MPSRRLFLLALFLALGNLWFTFQRSGIPADLTGRVERLESRREKHPGLDDVHLVTISGAVTHLDAEVAMELKLGDELRKSSWGAELETPRATIALHGSKDFRRMAIAMPLIMALAWILLLLGRRPREEDSILVEE